jgi:1,4-alpha-glucan branching enzyme
MIHKRLSTNKNKVIVRFEIPATIWAERINLVGEFNDWNSESLSFQRNRDDTWQIEIELECGHEYRFLYLIDGNNWCNDWHADKHVTNPYGGHDSIVVAEVPSDTEDSNET